MEITCYDKYGRVIENIVQWDVGQSISIKGYDLTSYAPQIHFANANSEKALVVESVLSGGLLSCQVPNSLARENLPIIMYIYDAVGETGKTNTIIKIPVTPRPMPDDVVYTDDVGVISLTEVLRQAREYMNNSLNYSTKAKESEEKAKTSADAAKVSETNAAKSENVASSSATQAAQSAKEAKAYVGSPLVANTVSAMTDQTKIYVYTGSESGYTAGNWYYHNGSAWVSGGVYNSSAVNVDKTLTQDGYAADAKVTGDAVTSLRGDLSNKITKFYASNQGETHITDSDNGKIQDMMIYGKSSQDGTPTPENPVEIKNVVNPTVKVCGKNLWNPILGGYISGNDGSIIEALKTSVAVTDFIKTSGKDITVIARNFSSTMENSYAYRIGFYDDRKKWIKNITLLNGSKYSINTSNITGTEYIRVSAPSGIYDTIQIEKGSEATPYEPYTEQSVQLPYTLNAIPVTSGGNVTIDGQQYIADYVNVERGKLVRMIGVANQDAFATSKWESTGSIVIFSLISNVGNDYAIVTISSEFTSDWLARDEIHHFTQQTGQTLVIVLPKTITTVEQGEEIRAKGFKFYYILVTPIEIDLTTEEITAFKALATYYPTTNISVNSEQLDGYTVFNYPISMQNGWNYVKQQLNDNRDYIYDMDLQSAEAYVNSEYAVALTELEV